MEAKELSTGILDILLDFPQISLVYLFGSRAGGSIGPMSDYDLAILIDHSALNAAVQANFAHSVANWIGTAAVDAVVLNRAPVELAYQVIANGQVLFQRDLAARVEYEADVMSRYGDYLPILRAQRDQILQGETHEQRVQRYRKALGRTQRAYRSPVPPEGKEPRGI